MDVMVEAFSRAFGLTKEKVIEVHNETIDLLVESMGDLDEIVNHILSKETREEVALMAYIVGQSQIYMGLIFTPEEIKERSDAFIYLLKRAIRKKKGLYEPDVA